MSTWTLQRSGHAAETNASARWICCQLGAREHYSIPRALNRAGVLERLLTDIWFRSGALQTDLLFQRLQDRFHPELPQARIVAWNARAALFEMRQRWRQNGWSIVMNRNLWFQDKVLTFLRDWHGEPGILFSFSYTAGRVFEFAKRRGWKLVLGQIDAGPTAERIGATLHAESGQPAGSWHPAPPAYWDSWGQECVLADQIIVNSEWSRCALLEEGIEQRKISVVPLVYESPLDAMHFRRAVPIAFSRARPLRILFLGQANLCKGMGVVMEVMRRMANAPVEFQIVGPVSVPTPVALQSQGNIRWEGAVPRSHTQRFYRSADVFLFPSFSDGFGLTQLEAQAWKLPVIASRFCGDVVQDGINGILLPEVTPDAVEAALGRCLENPEEVVAMSRNSRIEPRFSMNALQRHLHSLSADLRC